MSAKHDSILSYATPLRQQLSTFCGIKELLHNIRMRILSLRGSRQTDVHRETFLKYETEQFHRSLEETVVVNTSRSYATRGFAHPCFSVEMRHGQMHDKANPGPEPRFSHQLQREPCVKPNK